MTKLGRHTCRRTARLLVLVGVLNLVATSAASAQRYAPAAWVKSGGHPAERIRATSPVFAAAVADSAGAAVATAARVEERRGARVFQHAAVGTLIGAVATALTVRLYAQTGDYSDHSMDPVAYVVLVPAGAAAGAVVGAVVGLVRTR